MMRLGDDFSYMSEFHIKPMPSTLMTEDEMKEQCEVVSSCPELSEADEINL